MREILFRGKTLLGKWIEGDLLNYLGYGKVHIVRHCLGAGGQEVIPETVGQYTGLTDKNGKKIFEGDVVRTTFDDYNTKNLVCFWNESNIEFGLEKDDFDIGLGYLAPLELEVIGNIHDNPELLKGTENNV